ncbi:hypothetical protein NKI77_15760 [Mesorhizobium opportunistum]|uniref:Uncharacterized protein n=1 Tax=Mesorhizobium opportunistum TaxID=593909 RepID=A0ABV1YQZ6_9HYPH|nr:hypothetical protein [Mesorhizobium sp.]TJV17647.1 MAG: hypothetical protein E5Y07_11140 [Mesorhizobium sp.]
MIDIGQLIVELTGDPMDTYQARVLSYAFINGYVRPSEELISILVRHPGLEDPIKTKQAIEALIQSDLLVESKADGVTSVTVRTEGLPPNVEATFAKFSPLRKSVEPGNIRILGSPREGTAYSSFLQLLGSAERSIDLWTASAASYRSALPILRERAEAGVPVRVLMADPNAVMRVRGAAAAKAAQDTIDEWRNSFESLTNISFRLYPSTDDFRLSGSVYVDRKALRLTLFDDRVKRGTEGVILELLNPPGIEANLCRLYAHEYDAAWSRSRGFGWLSNIRRIMSYITAERIVLLASVVLYLMRERCPLIKNNEDIVAGMAGTAVLLVLIKMLSSLGSLFRRLWKAAWS